MKFVAKNTNLRIILKPGLSPQPLAGFAGSNSLFVKFEDGIADVKDEESIKLMKKHRGFGTDFLVLDEEAIDPYAEDRVSSEPEHNITELKYGHVTKSLNPKPAVTFTKEQQKVIKGIAAEMAAPMAKEMAMDILKQLKEKADAQKEVKAPVESFTPEESTPEGEGGGKLEEAPKKTTTKASTKKKTTK